MKVNKLSRVLIVFTIVLFVAVGFLSYYVQNSKVENSKLKLSVGLSNKIINNCATSKAMLESVLANTNKLSNKIQLENIELKKELEELKE